jgi:hypothetical protein
MSDEKPPMVQYIVFDGETKNPCAEIELTIWQGEIKHLHPEHRPPPLIMECVEPISVAYDGPPVQTTTEYRFRGHTWSGWPGAWCFDCGCEDPFEACMGGCDQAPSDEMGYPEPSRCPIHGQMARPCPTPGSNNFNPYILKGSR